MSEETKSVDTATAERMAEQVQNAQGEQNVDLTIADLNALKVIIDVASQRGAFKPNEMETVGKTYNRLNNFLIAVQAKQQQPVEGGAKAAE